MRAVRATGAPTRLVRVLCALSDVSYAHAEQRFHRFERAGQLASLARKAEAQISFAMRAEVDARHAADSPVLDQMLGRAPRALVDGLRADAEECVEGAGRRLTREDLAGIFADPAIEEIAPRAQLGAELLDAFLRSFERADASVLHDR